MKKMRKKLALNKTTLRQLDGELQSVAGGWAVASRTMCTKCGIISDDCDPIPVSDGCTSICTKPSWGCITR